MKRLRAHLKDVDGVYRVNPFLDQARNHSPSVINKVVVVHEIFHNLTVKLCYHLAKASRSLATFLIRNVNRELFVCGKDQLGCSPLKSMQ